MTTVGGFKITKRTRKGIDKLYLNGVADEKLAELAEQALTRPSDSMWFDDQMYSTHTQMFSTVDPDLSEDDLIGLSNYQSVGEALREVWPNAVTESSFGHWTYSRFLALKVRVLQGDGSSREIHPAFAAACSIALKLIDSPLFDDDHYNGLESARWEVLDVQTVADLNASIVEDEDDPEFGMADDDRLAYVEDVLQWLHENDGQGYRSECFYPDEQIENAREWARNRVGMVRHGWNDPALF